MGTRAPPPPPEPFTAVAIPSTTLPENGVSDCTLFCFLLINPLTAPFAPSRAPLAIARPPPVAAALAPPATAALPIPAIIPASGAAML